MVLASVVLVSIVFVRSEMYDTLQDKAVFFRIAKLGSYVPKNIYRHKNIVALGRVLEPQAILPRYFKYKESLLVPVRSQGKCASCWAFAIADMLGDRVSLYTGGKRRENLSVQEMLACFMPSQFHCRRGGIPEVAYWYPIVYGLVTESEYPYAQERDTNIADCQSRNGVSFLSYWSERRNEDYPHRIFGKPASNRNLCDSKTFIKSVLEQNIINMKTEIWLNGPIVGTLMVYDDLYKYDAESVYTVGPKAKFRGGHAIEIFGWCDEGQNTEEEGFQGAYWICRNSWGKRWPRRMEDKYGWFYVRMGTDEAGIESRASSCLPWYTREMQRQRVGREKTAYQSYDAYVNDPERKNFFAHLQRRRKT